MNIQASVSAAWAKIQGMINGLILLLPNIMLALSGRMLGSVLALLIDSKLINRANLVLECNEKMTLERLLDFME